MTGYPHAVIPVRKVCDIEIERIITSFMSKSDLAQCGWSVNWTRRFLVLVLVSIEVSATVAIAVRITLHVTVATDGVLLGEAAELLQRLTETAAIEHPAR